MGLFDIVADFALGVAAEAFKETSNSKNNRTNQSVEGIVLSPRGALFLAGLMILYVSKENSNKFNKKLTKLKAIEGEDLQSIDFKEAVKILDYLGKNVESPHIECLKIIMESISIEDEQEYTILLTLIDLALADGILEEGEEQILVYFSDFFNIDIQLVNNFIELLGLKNRQFPKNKSGRISDYSSVVLAKLSACYSSEKVQRQLEYIDTLEENSVDAEIALKLFQSLELDEVMFPFEGLVNEVEHNISRENKIVALLNVIDIASLDTMISDTHEELIEKYIEYFNTVHEDIDLGYIEDAINILTIKNLKLPHK